MAFIGWPAKAGRADFTAAVALMLGSPKRLAQGTRIVDDSQSMPHTSTATTTFDADEARRAELAEFLKSRRAAIAPARVGLKAGLRRRASGLLREEVAQL